MIGQTLAHYEITASLGKGGMGEVWRARDTKLEREVAIKTLASELAQDTDRLARFEREAKLLAALNHAHIASIYGLDEHAGTKFLVMELVEGGTLADRLEAGPLLIEDTLQIALQIAEALEAAHEAGVVHRDLKPANIMVTADGNVKVLDFGLAKAFAGDPNQASAAHSPALSLAMTQQGIILGTAGYMSPEQASGQATDKRADVWSFGVVLYEMLTGLPLFTGESVPHILASVLQSEPDWSRLPKNLHPRLKMLLERCLDKKLRNRYHDIADVRVDIEKVLADPEGIVSQPSEPAAAAARSKLPQLAAAVVLTAVVIGAAVWIFKPEPTLAVNRFSHVLPEGTQFTNTGRAVVAVSPDGSRMVFVANQQLHSRMMDTLESSPIPGTNETPTSPFFSPDGQWIGYWSGVDGQLKKIGVSGGAPVALTAAENPFGSPVWGSDDSIVWSQSEGIMRVSANGGVPAILIAGDGFLINPQILPDGDSVLFHVGGAGNGEIFVESLESGERRALFAGSFPRYVPTGHIVYGLNDMLFALPFDLATLEARGGPVPLVEGLQAGPMQYALSDSGSLVYVPGAGGVEAPRTLALVDRNGLVEPLNVRPAAYVMPSMSPDGSRLAVQTLNPDGTGAIWVYDLSGETQIRQLTQQGNNVRPIWTPDGERVTYASDRDGPRSIYWQTADGRGLPERLTTAEAGSVDAPQSWSGDGRHLSFVRVGGGNTRLATSGGSPRLWTLSLDADTEPSVFNDAPGAGLSAFSPDGQWLAYDIAETGRSEIYVQPFPRTGLIHQITQEGGVDPQWSSDGDELFFVRPDSGQLVAVDIRTDGAFAFGNERPLPIDGFVRQLTYRNYDVTPDDQRFLVALPVDETGGNEAARPRINIVTNWFEELKARVPTQ